MPEFLHLLPPPDALALLLRHLPDSPPAAETIPATQALGRVTADPIRAPHPLPDFPRSTVDGYAVRAADTFGASDGLPAYLQLVGEVPMGAKPEFTLAAAQAALIHTGGMLPEGADAVVMLENTQVVNLHAAERQARGGKGKNISADSALSAMEIEILRAVAVEENSLQVGEDVAEGQVVIPAGTRLRPAEVGGLMALGVAELRVARKTKVGIISSGDEVIPPQDEPRAGQVRDVNSYSLAALATEAGGEPVLYGIAPDQLAAMQTTAARALVECDLVVITAGSSASARDMTAEVIRSLGAPGVLVHGVNVRPGKPTVLGVCAGKAVIGLPGNPVSALVIAGLFVVPVIERLLGLRLVRPRPSVAAKLTVNVPSQAGREDWVAVKLLCPKRSEAQPSADEGWLAEPIFGKSNFIFTLAAADGLIRIPPDATGLSAGEMVEVVLL